VLVVLDHSRLRFEHEVCGHRAAGLLAKRARIAVELSEDQRERVQHCPR
jgi:hypothetical protein